MKIKYGIIKSNPADFIVVEEGLYDLAGSGQHLYLYLEKQLLTTDEVVAALCHTFDLKRFQIGVAGLKDKYAITTQFFSLDVGVNFDHSIIEETISSMDIDIKLISYTKHNAKLKRGHLSGNYFEINVTGQYTQVCNEILNEIENTIKIKGMPNFYGPQRFGSKNNNHILGLEVLEKTKKVKNRNRRNIYLQAYQSSLFNIWLKEKYEKDSSLGYMIGDYVMKHDRGRPNLVTSENIDKLKSEDNILTGILYAKDNLKYLSDSDKAFLESKDISLDLLSELRLDGGRRLACVMPKRLEVIFHEECIRFKFFLPKGSYATTLLDMFYSKIDNGFESR